MPAYGHPAPMQAHGFPPMGAPHGYSAPMMPHPQPVMAPVHAYPAAPGHYPQPGMFFFLLSSGFFIQLLALFSH